MRWTRFALLCLAVVVSLAAHSAPVASPMGINGASWSHLGANTDAFDWDRGIRRLDSLQAMGAAWDRCDFWWHVIEPQPGRFEFRDYDRVVDEYRRRGLHLMPILAYDAAWHPGQSPNTAAYREEYGRFVYETVLHFKGRISAYEIWNEPNISQFWRKEPSADDYTALLKVAYREAKRADPSVTVVGGAVAGMDFTFIEAILRGGAGDAMDALSVHPYQGNLGSVGPEEGRLVEDLRRLKALLKERGHADMPVWITEVGHRTQPDPSVPKGGQQPTGRVTEKQQANYLVRTFALALSEGVERIFWFNLQDWPTETWGTIDEQFRRKPSWFTYRMLSENLAGARFSRALPGKPGSHVLAFVKSNGPVLIGWTEGVAQTVGLEGVTGAPSLVYARSSDNRPDPRSIAMPVEAGRTTLPLHAEPVFVQGLGGIPEVSGSPIIVTLRPSRLAPGGTFALSLSYDNTRLKADLEKTSPEVVFYPEHDAQRGVSTARSGARWKLPATGLAPGKYAAEVRWRAPSTSGGPAWWRAVAPVEIVPTLAVGVQPAPTGGRDLLVTVTNHTGADIYATVTADIKGSRIDTTKNVLVRAGGSGTVDVTNVLPESTPLTVPAPVVVTAQSPAGSATWQGNIYFMSAGYRKPGTVVRLDSAQQWQSQDGSWTGPEDLSARVVTSWDEAGMSLRAVVTDDIHSQPNTLGQVWRADSIQVALDPGWSRRPDATTSTEFGLALTPSGPQVYRWTGPGTPGLVPGAVLKVTREGTSTTYEASIPWREIGVTAGMKPRAVGFSFIVNDADGAVREGWLAYGDGIATEKRADRYGTLNLMPK